MSPGGSGPIWNIDFDTIGFGWKPTALLIALTMATPISFKRRCRALLFGLLAEYAFILWSLGFFIWIESAGLSLVELTPFGKKTAESFVNELRLQMGFVPPIMIWILVSFNRSDATLFANKLNYRRTLGKNKLDSTIEREAINIKRNWAQRH